MVVHVFVFGGDILIEPDANKLVALPYLVSQFFVKLSVNHVDALYNFRGQVVVCARIAPVVLERENNEFVCTERIGVERDFGDGVRYFVVKRRNYHLVFHLEFPHHVHHCLARL